MRRRRSGTTPKARPGAMPLRAYLGLEQGFSTALEGRIVLLIMRARS